MNILIIHNRYSIQGGEESVCAMQETLFREKGHVVHTYYRSHSEIKKGILGKIKSAFTALLNPSATREIMKIVKDNKIEAAFIHNLYPIISPSILPSLSKHKVKTILFTHNYRLICPTGLFFRGGIVCEKCGDLLKELNAICYCCEGTLLGSTAHALRNFSARIFKLYKNNITHYAALTEFQREKLIKYGYDKDKITVIPNFTTFSATSNINNRNGKVLFVGRLSNEKGYDLLFGAARKLPHIEFTVAGAYTEQTNLKSIPKNITLLGIVDKNTIITLYQSHSLIAITSRCYEAFPLTILEAAITHCPIIAPRMGAMQSIIDDKKTGILFEPYNTTDLAEKIITLLSNPQNAKSMADNNFTKCTINYSADIYYKKTIDILLQ